ncbi:Hsp20/alpha crystallin family protein [Paenibacillus abyssi]|uniref:CS domain-containing protein n=1 Tax=Paenibacillus abyssi TaxID=1340531 RepID=A0A917FSD9_9BACL|nr:Hsp20/alpha crystallin family protein [Paenibacillus abyssi]GGF98127.1 hypothetical protein GCM10010916_14190 [Paenibacillus abyssi]
MDNQQQPMFDWDEFGKYMRKQFPFIADQPWLEITGTGKNKEPQHAMIDWDEFGKYMKKQIPFMDHNSSWLGISGQNSSSSPSFNPFAPAGLDYEMFETHRSIYIQCQIPKNISPNDLKFYAAKRKLKIEYSGITEEIQLKYDVNPNRSTARIKDGILEIRMPKLSENQPFQEISIRE